MITIEDFKDYVIISIAASDTRNKRTKFLEVLTYPTRNKIIYRINCLGYNTVYPIHSFQQVIKIFNET